MITDALSMPVKGKYPKRFEYLDLIILAEYSVILKAEMRGCLDPSKPIPIYTFHRRAPERCFHGTQRENRETERDWSCRYENYFLGVSQIQ